MRRSLMPWNGSVLNLWVEPGNERVFGHGGSIHPHTHIEDGLHTAVMNLIRLFVDGWNDKEKV